MAKAEYPTASMSSCIAYEGIYDVPPQPVNKPFFWNVRYLLWIKLFGLAYWALGNSPSRTLIGFRFMLYRALCRVCQFLYDTL